MGGARQLQTKEWTPASEPKIITMPNMATAANPTRVGVSRSRSISQAKIRIRIGSVPHSRADMLAVVRVRPIRLKV